MTEQLDSIDEAVVAFFRQVRSLVRFLLKVGPPLIAVVLVLAAIWGWQQMSGDIEALQTHVQGQEIVNRRVHAELGLPEKSFAERLEAEYEREE